MAPDWRFLWGKRTFRPAESRVNSISYRSKNSLEIEKELSLKFKSEKQSLNRKLESEKQSLSRKLESEKQSHQNTRHRADAISDQYSQIKEKIDRRCQRRAGVIAWTFSSLIAIILIIGCFATLGHKYNIFHIDLIVGISGVIFGVFALASLAFGLTIRHFHQRIRNRCLNYLLEKEYTKNLELRMTDHRHQ